MEKTENGTGESEDASDEQESIVNSTAQTDKVSDDDQSTVQKTSPKTNDKEVHIPTATPRENEAIVKKEETKKSVDKYVPKVQNILPEYPKPSPPAKKREEVYCREDSLEADEFAHFISFAEGTTVEALGRQFDMPNDIQRARAILSWIALQDLYKQEYGEDLPNDSVQYLFKLIVNQDMSMNALFTMLCREAGIACVLIEGIAKAPELYDVGQSNVDNLRGNWCAIHVGLDWRLVFPQWILDSSRESGKSKQRHRSIDFDISMDDFFFLTDPENFIYWCYPDDETWQLSYKTITKEIFAILPYCTESFFKKNLEIMHRQSCVIEAMNGHASVSLKPKHYAENVHLSCNIYYDEQRSKDQIKDTVHLEKYVCIMHHERETKFEFRLPMKGEYELIITDDNEEWIVFFKVVCDKVSSQIRPFPAALSLGYGPSVLCRNLGLVPETHKDCLLVLRQKKPVQIVFKLTRDVKAHVSLLCSFKTTKNIQSFVSYKIRRKELVVTVELPSNDEYALEINTAEKGEEHFKNAFNYLLTFSDPKKVHKKFENAFEKKARRHLRDCIKSCSEPDVILKALEAFNELELVDRGENAEASKKISILNHLNELNDAILRKKLEILEAAISNARHLKHYLKVKQKLREAEAVLQKLKQVKRLTNEVPELSQNTVSEIRLYVEPVPQVIYDVMRATFILIGEEQPIYEWFDIQALMKRTNKKGLLYLMNHVTKDNLDPTAVKKVEKIMKDLDQEKVNAHSSAVGAFYNWNTEIIKMFKSKSSRKLLQDEQ